MPTAGLPFQLEIGDGISVTMGGDEPWTPFLSFIWCYFTGEPHLVIPELL